MILDLSDSHLSRDRIVEGLEVQYHAHQWVRCIWHICGFEGFGRQ